MECENNKQYENHNSINGVRGNWLISYLMNRTYPLLSSIKARTQVQGHSQRVKNVKLSVVFPQTQDMKGFEQGT